jgi:hypothetical protein
VGGGGVQLKILYKNKYLLTAPMGTVLALFCTQTQKNFSLCHDFFPKIISILFLSLSGQIKAKKICCFPTSGNLESLQLRQRVVIRSSPVFQFHFVAFS